ncbi:MAG: hypothetical protein O3A63_06575 [Proteobacteria bacterium]|nr:hypothetical protein [Pseudomonadota bacterium]
MILIIRPGEQGLTFDAGPFFLVEKIELAWGIHRGREQKFLHTSAYGQWGSLMVELVQQDEEGPSPFRDVYAPGEEGIHHMAMMVDSLELTYERIRLDPCKSVCIFPYFGS